MYFQFVVLGKSQIRETPRFIRLHREGLFFCPVQRTDVLLLFYYISCEKSPYAAESGITIMSFPEPE